MFSSNFFINFYNYKKGAINSCNPARLGFPLSAVLRHQPAHKPSAWCRFHRAARQLHLFKSAF